MRRLAIIPARSGSKRLPGKNTKLLRNKPLVQYSIEAALKTGLFETVLVTTDDTNAYAIAEECGAVAWRRPPELAGDTASVNQTIHHVLQKMAGEDRHFDEICCLYATSPLRDSHDISEAHRLLEPGVCDFVIAVSRYMHSPYQALKLNEDGILSFIWPEVGVIQSQNLPVPLVDNGSTYWATTKAYLEQGSFYGSNLKGYEMPVQRSIDIDTQEDFDMAAMISGDKVQN